MRKETERKINEEAADYNHFSCGSSVLRMRKTFYHAIESYKKFIWHNYTEEPTRGQRIVMIRYTEIGGGIYVGNGQVEECGVRKPMMSGCKWCYLCDIYEQKKFCKDCLYFVVRECSWWCSKGGNYNYDIDPYDEACKDCV